MAEAVEDWRQMTESSGHAHDLRLAFERPGCPVCELSRRSVERYLDILAFESVNDVGLRERLRSARGLCNYHSWQFLGEAGQIMGTAIVVRDLLRTLRRETERLPPDASFARQLAAAAPCLACEIRRQSEASYAAVLVEQLGGAEFRRAFEGSDGLCWYHFRVALGGASGRRARRLAESWRTVQHTLLITARQNAEPATSTSHRTADPQHAPARPIRAGKPLGAEVGRRRPRSTARRLWIAAFGEPGLTDAFGEVEPLETGGQRAVAVEEKGSLDDAEESEDCAVCVGVETGQARRQPLFTTVLCNRHAHLRSPLAEGMRVEPALLSVLESRIEAVEQATRARQGPSDRRRFWARPRDLLRGLGLDFGAGGDALLAALPPDEPCADCVAQEAVEREAIARLGTVERAPAVCRVHLMPALASGLPFEVRRALVARQHAHWEGLAEELGEYIRKQDYRFRDEPRGVEQSAPWRGLEMIAGRQGVR